MVETRSVRGRLNTALLYLGVGLTALLCLAPMVHIFAVSLSDRAATTGGLVGFWPVRFTTVSYEKVLQSAAFAQSLQISLLRTALGTALIMVLTVLTAYPLSRTGREFPGRGVFMGLLLFAVLFSGGLIPLYMTIRQLGLFNSIWALILPMALPIWNVLMLMNFFRDVPRELEEAAVIDGASHWQLLWRVHLPLAAPALATLTLFCAVGLWNEWFLGMVFVQDDHYPLQTYLRSIIISQDLSKVITDPSQIANFSDRSVKAAQIFVTTLPILLLYPLLQGYFVTGIKLGAVKG